MATGFTYKIYEDISFENFALACSRNFGALIHMRDENSDVEIELIKPSIYHVEQLSEAKEELSRLKSLNDEEINELCEESNKASLLNFEKRTKKTLKKHSQLLSMKTKVLEWKPPTKEHDGMKEFMLSQINTTIEHDCYEHNPAHIQSSEEWIECRLKSAEWDISYHQKGAIKDKKRNDSCNLWILHLLKSLGKEEMIAKLTSDLVSK